jgi:hypothetical protein
LFHSIEKNGWGNRADRIFALVRGIPLLTAHIDLYNLKGQAINLESWASFDAQKRRAFSVSAPWAAGPPGEDASMSMLERRIGTCSAAIRGPNHCRAICVCGGWLLASKIEPPRELALGMEGRV